MPALIKRARNQLDLDGVGSEHLKRLMSNLSQVVVVLRGVRNLAGTEHGRVGSEEPDPVLARLAVDCAVAASRFILDLHADTA